MKKLFLAVALFATISMATYAAPKNGKRGGNHDKALKELNLSADQQKKVETINTEFGTKMKALKDNDKLSKDERTKQSKELRGKKQEQIRAVLTPEQQTKLKETRKHRTDKRGGKKGREMAMHGRKGDNRKGYGRSERGQNSNLVKQLELTDAQKQQMQAIKKTYAMKQGDLQQQQKAELENILTPQQKAKKQTLQTEKLAQRLKISTEGATKLQALKSNYKQEKKAVEMSRIAPEAQKERLLDLRSKFRTDSKEILKQYKL